MGAGQRAVAGTGIQAKQFNVGVVVADVDFNLLIGAGNQERRGVAGHGHFAANCQTGGGAHQRLLRDTHVDQAIGECFDKGRNFRG